MAPSAAASRSVTDDPAPADVFGLLPALQRLDDMLARAVDAAAELYGPEASSDPYRGLVIGPEEATGLLRRDAGQPLFAVDDGGAAGGGPELARLTGVFGLIPFDLDLLVIATAPELDLRYERIYAYLQDDVTRRRPSVDLALNLLCASAAERIAARSRFAPDAPLVRHGLLHLAADSSQPQQPLLARTMTVDEQVLHLLIRQSSLDSRLASCARLTRSRAGLASLDLDMATRRALPGPAAGHAGSPPPRLYLQGPADAGQHEVAAALAADAGVALLSLDLDRAARAQTPVDELIRVAFRQASLHGTAILVTGVDAVRAEAMAAAHDHLCREVASSRVLTVLAGRQPWAPAGPGTDGPGGVVPVPLGVPAVDVRRTLWRRGLTAAGIRVDDEVVERLAAQFRLTAARMEEAVATARNRAAWTGRPAQGRDLVAAARGQSGHELETLARKVEPVYPWDALVLPEETLQQLRELRDRVAQRQRVLEEWGFGRSLALGRGICALFVGPSGTGKTMAADVVAGALGLDLYKIDLATVVSKYIGETEKNLERIFSAAENANGVLFFDEADAIFGKRSEVRDAHDRYANLEIAFLLQRMEQYDGIAILATNLRENLDDAFLRRLHFIVDFPMPTAPYRERMWRRFIPAEAPTDDGIDYGFLARQFRLSGGSIKNIVLSSAYAACANGGRIGMSHLVRASWREHQKIGRVLSESDIGEYAGYLPGPVRDDLATG